jgi:uncharacterized integral membrane protein
MAGDPITYDVTFEDFKFLQGFIVRRVSARNRRKYLVAFVGVVLCAIFLAMAIVINVNPYRAAALGFGVRYPFSVYLLLIFCLSAAILCLIPAVKLRLKTLRLQISDDGPLLGPTKLTVGADGLTIDRRVLRTTYSWAAFQGVDIVKNAVILTVDNGFGVIIPASAFSSNAERYDFAALISKRLEDRVPKTP